MSRIQFYGAMILACGLSLGMAAYLGRFTQAKQLAAAAERVNRVPREFGDWKTVSEEPLPPRAVKLLECAAHVNRTYVNQVSGESVGVVVMVGPPGPMIGHRPEICLPNQGFGLITAQQPVSFSVLGESGNELFRSIFRSPRTGTKYEVYYGWNSGGCWEAFRNPRFAVSGGTPLLFKIQVITSGTYGEVAEEESPARLFLRDSLPALQDVLFGE